MKKINGLNLLKLDILNSGDVLNDDELKKELSKIGINDEYNKIDEKDELCNNFLIPLLKENFTNEEKMPLFVKTLKKIDIKENLTKEEELLNHWLKSECRIYISKKYNILFSNLKEETKKDLVIYDFSNKNDINNNMEFKLNNYLRGLRERENE